ncbi:hypothetical protein AM1BK_15010 [Neobacillus kokaensis]|uniref:Uncharacterized protein n=1 Tax=Neobacillus kokaensis TaxID=2759023 RepID=A0ABQ3MZ60_9BACI|nr:hypothetical protein AM1BK_15010 [Neobacillus kokaensis]
MISNKPAPNTNIGIPPISEISFSRAVGFYYNTIFADNKVYNLQNW